MQQQARSIISGGSAEDGSSAVGAAGSPLKGVLKKVHFNDEVAAEGVGEGEKEGVKSTQHSNTNSKTPGTEKVVLPGTDVVVEAAKTPLLSSEGKEGSVTDSNAEAEDEGANLPKLDPIDLMTPFAKAWLVSQRHSKAILLVRRAPSHPAPRLTPLLHPVLPHHSVQLETQA